MYLIPAAEPKAIRNKDSNPIPINRDKYGDVKICMRESTHFEVDGLGDGCNLHPFRGWGSFLFHDRSSFVFSKTDLKDFPRYSIISPAISDSFDSAVNARSPDRP